MDWVVCGDHFIVDYVIEVALIVNYRDLCV